MAFSVNDVIPLSQARANFSELAEQAKAGAEKIITRNGESYVALIDAERLDYYHRLERERIHLLLIDEARKGLVDAVAGRVKVGEHVAAGAQAPSGRQGLTLTAWRGPPVSPPHAPSSSPPISSAISRTSNASWSRPNSPAPSTRCSTN